jgi:hypothetical protein
MAEGLFVLTVIFVAYVVYVVVNDQRATTKSTIPQVKPEKQEVAAVQPQIEAAPQKEAPATRRAAARPAAAARKTAPATPAPTSEAGKGELRNPATGEVVSAHSNYRFTKRWVKEALVAEGLLEKIYKNNELDAAAEAKIKEAMAKLEAMDKYRA